MRQIARNGGLLLLAVCQPAFANNTGGNGIPIFFTIFVVVAAYLLLKALIDALVERKMAQRFAEIETKEHTERAKTLSQIEEAQHHQEEILLAHQSRVQALTNAFEVNYINGRGWLAEFIADAFQAPDEATALMLESKKNPAHKAAEEVRRISAQKRALLTRLKQLEYTLKTYHEYYPVLEQYQDEILNEEATLNLDNDSDSDRVSRFISQQEYSRLTTAERNQLALDKWKARPKSSVEIGRLFERYLGFLYENDGWAVDYFGANEGLEDMGRDLLCRRGNSLHVVQAKYWAKHRTLHEKHIFQLYGTTVLLPLTFDDLEGIRIKPVLATTTNLSETAVFAAQHLGVEVRILEMDRDYPLIKCNVNGKNKIYHLPFDQQYDRVRICPEKGEMYVHTTQEAEELGFRRAMRHMG